MSTTRAHHWRERLRKCEQLLALPPTRGTWLRRAYARIYRFLLSQYSDRPTVCPPLGSTMPLVDLTDSLEGKPARTPGELQATLKHIHAAQPTDSPPAAPKRSEDDMWVVVLDQQKRHDFVACRKLLSSQGIPWQELKRSMHRQLQVPANYRQQAFTLLAAHREEIDIPQRVRVQRRYAKHWRSMLLMVGVGMVVGSLLACIPIVAEAGLHGRRMVVVIFSLMSLILGAAAAGNWMIHRVAGATRGRDERF